MKKYNYDFQNYDRFTMLAKKNKKNELLKYYTALDFKLIKQKNHPYFEDEIYLTFEREHFVKNKYELQYIQVELESNLNEIAKLENKIKSKTTIVGITLGLASFIFQFFGIYNLCQNPKLNLAFYIVSTLLGVCLLVCNIIVCKKIYKDDSIFFNNKINDLKQENIKIYNRLQALKGVNYEK